MTLSIVPLYAPTRGVFLVSEMPLYIVPTQGMGSISHI